MPETTRLVFIFLIAVTGHVMALIWYIASVQKWKLCERTIYNLPVNQKQIAREINNSIFTPIHAIILLVFMFVGSFKAEGVFSFLASLVITSVWAEVWHYWSHRAMHLKRLHWIHVEHHRSALNSPFTAISFSFSEKIIFDIGLLAPLALLDLFYPMNLLGIATWYIAYLVINSFSHANFELKSRHFNRFLGKALTSTTYHSLHHSRYTGNYGLGTRILDRLFGTEWEDYEALYERISVEQRPLTALREKVEVQPKPQTERQLTP